MHKNKTFVLDCIARALNSLPWASIGLDEKGERECPIVRKLQEEIRRGEFACTEDMLLREIEVHDTCGNGMKADFLEDFRCGMAATIRSLTKKQSQADELVKASLALLDAKADQMVTAVEWERLRRAASKAKS